MIDESFASLAAADQVRAHDHLNQILSLTATQMANPGYAFETAMWTMVNSAVQLQDAGVPDAHIVHLVKCALYAMRNYPPNANAGP
jgi:hypothetical protein